jgi:hypothetical protein
MPDFSCQAANIHNIIKYTKKILFILLFFNY